MALYDFYQARVDECDVQIERTLAALTADKAAPQEPLVKARTRSQQPNALSFDVRSAMYQLAGVDLTQIHGIGPYLALRLVAECCAPTLAAPATGRWAKIAARQGLTGR